MEVYIQLFFYCFRSFRTESKVYNYQKYIDLDFEHYHWILILPNIHFALDLSPQSFTNWAFSLTSSLLIAPSAFLSSFQLYGSSVSLNCFHYANSQVSNAIIKELCDKTSCWRDPNPNSNFSFKSALKSAWLEFDSCTTPFIEAVSRIQLPTPYSCVWDSYWVVQGALDWTGYQ